MDGRDFGQVVVQVMVMVMALATAAGCAGKPSGSHGDARAGDSGCDLAALGLSEARSVPAWTPPTACTPKAGDAGDRIILRTEAEFAARFTCPDGTGSGIDFTRHSLVIETRTLSPAGAGGQIVDDGNTLTYVAHFRRPCPDEPRPMPMLYKVMYLLPVDASRQFAEASCTVGGEPRCK